MTPESTRLVGMPPTPAMEKMPPGANGFIEEEEDDVAAAAAAAAAMAAANSSSFLMAFCGKIGN